MSACVKCGHDPSARVLASWSFHIDRDPPSLNARLFNAGTKRWAYKRERDAWCLEIRACRLLQRIPKATTKRRVTLRRNYNGRQKERDRDNLAGGMKCIVDALAFEGVIVGDAPHQVEVHYEQARTTPTGLVVWVEELATTGTESAGGR
jgi:hypothetical protein